MSDKRGIRSAGLFWLPLLFGMLVGIGFFLGRTTTSVAEAEIPSAPAVESEPAETIGEPRAATPRNDLKAEELETIALFQEAAPSVAFITSITERLDLLTMNVSRIPSGTGSGFVWDRAGHVVTNFHVIQNARGAQVTLSDGTTWNAELVGQAPEKDLAVLRIDAPPEALHPISLGRSDDLLVGQSVLAIGNPFGLDQTLTTGVISALGREIDSVARIPIRDVIQTDAAINPGNSGGPLLDSSGRLIGVNTAIYSPSGAYAGIGFAIPVDTVNWVISDLITYGRVQRPELGCTYASDRIAQRLEIEGVLVVDVLEGSGAEAAGLRPTVRTRRGYRWGDIIVAVEGVPVQTQADLQLALEEHEIGATVTVTFIRDGERLQAPVVLQPATE